MSRQSARWRWLIAAFLLVLASIGLIIIPAAISSKRPLSPLESSLVQGIGLALGLWGSYLFGKLSVRESASQLVEAHARSAFRRLIALYTAIGNMGQTVARAQSEMKKREGQWTAYDVLQAQIVQQLDTAGDAMEDWRDIVPGEVSDVEAKLRERRRERGSSHD